MSVDDRLRQAEIALSAVRQRVDDHEEDWKRFAPVVLELGELKWTLEAVKRDLQNAHELLRALDARIDLEHEERVAGVAARRQELEDAKAERDAELKQMEIAREAQAKEMRNRLHVATITLIGVFLTALAAVLVPILTGGGG